ncbi:MAG TPA: UDP-3-O-(3-hydroxymyristoyl)glucosamine N-acyltransferase, partial [Bacteroidia bacterium]|nr:UDP-3-O-(3-hydroxymyristoyl)glucosamine N-acyltransferase [Bacteroidia bacterium]
EEVLNGYMAEDMFFRLLNAPFSEGGIGIETELSKGMSHTLRKIIEEAHDIRRYRKSMNLDLAHYYQKKFTARLKDYIEEEWNGHLTPEQEKGDNCVLHPNVVVYDNCHLGNNVIIHANTVIGADAFYYKKREKNFDKLISCGRVIIEDDVEIGSGCTIDKGVSGDTIIGAGSKLDNQIQIGHDTQLGKMCLLASQVGVAGVVTLGDQVTLWGQVGIRSDVKIGTGAILLAQTGLAEDVPSGKTYFGTPGGEARVKMREMAAIKMLPDVLKKMNSNVPK